MPCSDGGVPYPPSREEQLQAKMPAVLCGLVYAMGLNKLIELVNWKEAGVTPAEFREWYAIHDARDKARRIREKEQQEREANRQSAKAKLTPDERKALGLED